MDNPLTLQEAKEDNQMDYVEVIGNLYEHSSPPLKVKQNG